MPSASLNLCRCSLTWVLPWTPGRQPSHYLGTGYRPYKLKLLVALLSTCRGMMRLMGLTNFASMSLPKQAFTHVPSVLVEGKVQASRQSFQTTKVYIGSTRIPALVVPFCQIYTLASSPGNCDNDASTGGYRGYMINLSIKDQWAGRKGRETHINILKEETV